MSWSSCFVLKAYNYLHGAWGSCLDIQLTSVNSSHFLVIVENNSGYLHSWMYFPIVESLFEQL